ncbi:hypothetical protein [Streptomyces ortus]|uniref:Uncharacterized protein n=1 Tax=Streptomyces ortus TaxID=2867268 RepID=A0ABT3UW78_9ACTN|nr:hypothetical protein [Streptomyces ortus]MCX4231747.1 hypothetical protein [Streptomyces ortus]
MPHFNVVTYPAGEYEDAPSLADWFDPGFATGYEEDAGNVCPTALGRYGHQALCRARDGRWLFNAWTEQEDSDTYGFVDDATAKAWLLNNGHHDAAEHWFGEQQSA